MSKKTKQILLVTFIVITVGLLIGGGYWLFSRQAKKTQNTNLTEDTKSVEEGGKTDTSSTVPTPVQTTPSTTTTATTKTLGVLSDVSLTANLVSEESIAQDGKTVIPPGSITPTFYTNTGNFTIQKMVAGVWKDIITNQVYPGHGGITAWFCGPTENNIQYRVLKVENGTPVSASKIFTVKRSDLTSGVKTYN